MISRSAPTIAGLSPESAGGALTLNIVVAIYLLVWMLTGLAALVVGVMIYPVNANGVAINSTISDLGTTWLGLAVSAVGRVYFELLLDQWNSFVFWLEDLFS